MAETKAEAAALVTLTIDGRVVSVPKDATIWMAAQQLGIEIPIYCYHPKMDPLGACRMCFVEVEKTPKLQTACTTTVAEGMVVKTDTELVKKGRQGTLEFLLINHPLDCPVCDKGGECMLQDYTLRHGPGNSRFDVAKRHFPKPIPVSQEILLDRERCIACQRCVRFCQEVAMDSGLVMKQRGYRTEVGPDPDAPFDSIFSGNVVEMCPVGALTAKSYRFVGRPWELKRTPSVCGNCSVGCNVLVDVRVDKVQRQYSRTNDDIDDGWLCDRGRWGLRAFNDPKRLRTPMIRQDGELRPATWDEALALVGQRLREIARRDGPRAIGGIGSTHITNEEAYLFQKLLRDGLGTPNVDHFHGVFPAQAASVPWVWTGSIAGLDYASHIVLLGGNPYQRQPIVDLRIRKAIRAGAKLYMLGTAPNQRLARLAAGVIRYSPGYTAVVAHDLRRLVEEGDSPTPFPTREPPISYPPSAAVRNENLWEELRELARTLKSASAATILYDEMETRNPDHETLAGDVLALALATGQVGRPGAGAGPLFEDVNSLGARDMGLLPDTLPGYRPAPEPGLAYEVMVAGGVKALYVIGANPARHYEANLDGLEFLVVQDLFLTETAERADVVLPAVSYAEKDGSFTNTERCVQAVRRAMIPLPGARADWEILRGVARALNLDWAYRGPGDVLAEIGRTVPIYAGLTRRALGATGLRWPIVAASATESNGATPLAGSAELTRYMLAQGFARPVAAPANPSLGAPGAKGEGSVNA